MSNISLPYSFLEGSSLDDKKISAFATKRIEPIFNGSNHYANRVIFNIQGEYLPLGLNQPIPTSPSVNIETFMKSFTNLLEGNCTLTNVVIQESNWLGRVPYEVDCECYAFVDENKNKTINASNEISVTENLDGTITINRNINVSAISITNSNPITDAKIFAQLLSGQTTNWRLSSSTSNKSQNFSIPILNSSSETADIFNGTYSIQQNFTANLLTKDFNKKGIVKQSLEIQSSIDGLSTINKKTTVIGGIDTTQAQLTSLANGNDAGVPGDYIALSKNSSYDDISKTLEVSTTFSNDKTITPNGNKVTNTLNFNFDFLNKNYTANFNSEVRPATIISSSPSIKSDLSKDIKTQLNIFSPIQSVDFILESSSEGEGKETRFASYNETYVFSPSIFGGQQGVDLYDVSLNVDYQPGYPLNTFTPILSGRGKYFLEDLDLVTNSTVNISINGKYVDSPPAKTLLDNAITSGTIDGLTKILILKEEMAVDKDRKTFNYSQQRLGNDSSFKDLK